MACISGTKAKSRVAIMRSGFQVEELLGLYSLCLIRIERIVVAWRRKKPSILISNRRFRGPIEFFECTDFRCREMANSCAAKAEQTVNSKWLYCWKYGDEGYRGKGCVRGVAPTLHLHTLSGRTPNIPPLEGINVGAPI